MKKIISLAICFALTTALVACGGKSNEGSTSAAGSMVQMGNVSSSAEERNTAPTDAVQMVRVNGMVYTNANRKSTVEGRCGMMDGTIVTTVAEGEIPTEDNQSNFGTGIGYQYGCEENTIELLIDNDWWVFEGELCEGVPLAP